jgi:16S rRNA processing protein RimM
VEPARLELGRIGRPHGVRGEVTVVLTTNRPERREPGAVLHTEDRELVVAGARPHRDEWILAFEGVSSRAAAEELRGARLFGDPIDDPGDDALWAHDLIGSDVRDAHGHELGRVRAIERNPAHDLLVLDDGLLIPVVFVVGHEPGRVTVDPPDGLLDVNR